MANIFLLIFGLACGVAGATPVHSSISAALPSIEESSLLTNSVRRERVAVPPMCYWNASHCEPLIPPEVRARIRAVLARNILDLDMGGIGEGLAHACWLQLGFPNVDECLPCSAPQACGSPYRDSEVCELYCPNDASSATQAPSGSAASESRGPGVKPTHQKAKTSSFILTNLLSSKTANATLSTASKTTNRERQFLLLKETAIGPWSTEDRRAATPEDSSFFMIPIGSEVRVRLPEGGILLVTAQLTVYARRATAIHLLIDREISSTCRIHGLRRAEQCTITYLTSVPRGTNARTASGGPGAEQAAGQGQAPEQFTSVALQANRNGLVVDTRAQLTRLSLAIWT